MEACGYTLNGRAIKGLKELTFICTEEELSSLIQFLSTGKRLLCDDADPKKHGFIPIDGRYCIEIRDWDRQWSRENPAIILYIEAK